MRKTLLALLLSAGLFSFVCFAEQDSISAESESTGEIKLISVNPEVKTIDTSETVEEPEVKTAEPVPDSTPDTAEEVPVDSSEVIIIDETAKSLEDTTQEPAQAFKEEPPAKMKRSGIGFNIGSRIFFPDEVNELIEDIWDEMKKGGITESEFGSPTMFLASEIKLKGIIYFVPFFCLEPFGQFLWSGKQLRIRGDVERDASINVIDLSGGLNCWFKVSPKKRASFKCGAGGFGGYTILKVSGDEGETELTGYSYGGNFLAGLDICFTRISINIDFIVPIGITDFSDRIGRLDFSTEYPDKLQHFGLEIRPGLTIQF
jgi:hypothetical protein